MGSGGRGVSTNMLIIGKFRVIKGITHVMISYVSLSTLSRKKKRDIY